MYCQRSANKLAIAKKILQFTYQNVVIIINKSFSFVQNKKIKITNNNPTFDNFNIIHHI